MPSDLPKNILALYPAVPLFITLSPPPACVNVPPCAFTFPAKVALPVSNAIDNGVILDVDKVKLVPDAVNIGSKPPPAKLSNINFGVDLLIVKSPAIVTPVLDVPSFCMLLCLKPTPAFSTY